MNSMNRMPTPRSRPKRARSTISSSLTPRITTALTFTGARPASSAASMPAITRSSSSRRVSARKRSRCSVSSETFTRLRPACREVVGDLGQLHAVGGEREVDAERRQHLDQPGHVGPHERLAAGEPDRLEPEPLDAHPGDPGDLLVGEHLGAGQPGHPLGRHAVGAAEIAAVGDRDPQVVDPARVAVDQRERRSGGGSSAQRRGDRKSAVGGMGGMIPCVAPRVGFALAPRRRSDQLQPADQSFPGVQCRTSPARHCIVEPRDRSLPAVGSPARATSWCSCCTTERMD